MHGTRAYASLCVLYVVIEREREREREKERKGWEERGGVNDRNAARSQRDAYITRRGSASSTPAEKIVKGLRHTDADLPV